MLDEYMIEEKFDKLMSEFSYHTISDFSACLFSLDYKKVQDVCEFDKFIYTKGNDQEVYTKKERDIISQIQSVCIISECCLLLKHHRVMCRVIALDLRSSTTPLYDAAAGMKICNKALDGYNTYILVCEDKIFIGCDSFGGESKTNCEISYPIKKEIEWDALFYLFLNIKIDKDFFDYYLTLIDVVKAVDGCYYTEKKDDEKLILMEDEDDTWYDLSDESLYIVTDEENPTGSNVDLISDYYLEASEIMMELSYIESNKVNPLEMLFEAEKLVHDEELANNFSTKSRDEYVIKDEHRVLLSDPEKLIKLLKGQSK